MQIGRRLAAGALVMAMATAGVTAPARADTALTNGTTASTTTWTSGSSQRWQSHNGDDISFRKDSGYILQMRWATCTLSTHGSAVTNMTSGNTYTIGTNFLQDTCFRLQYRAQNTPGTFTGLVRWNENWV